MADVVRLVRVFISSPSDVRPERSVASRVVRRLGREFSPHFSVEGVLWEREPMVASHQFQELIVPPRETDIVVVMLWSRLGMPLPDEARWKGPLTGKRVTGTEWEFEDALAGYRERAVPDLLVYRKRADILVALGDRAALDEQQRQAELVNEFMGRWFRDAEGKSATAASRSFANGAELEEMLEQNLRELLRKRLTAAAGPDRPRSWYQGSPYRGLEAFGPEHEPIFFGRTRARNEVRELLARQAARGCAFVLVMGASGSGKSSLVKAGVLPELREAGMVGRVALVREAITRPGAAGDPVSGLAAALLGETALPELARAPLEYTADRLARLLRKVPDEAAQPIRQGLSAAGQAARLTEHGEARLLLVVDQLEELFTAEAILEEARERYASALHALASSGLVWVIATMRSDFFDRLERLPTLATLADGEAKYLLTAPGGPEIGQIIRQPAREAALSFEVDERTGRSLDETIRVAASDGGSLPLLEYLLDQLWHRRTEHDLLTYRAYEEMGGLEGAIGRRAEEVLASQAPEVQAALPRVLRALVTVRQGGQVTARHARIEQFEDGGAEQRLIAALLNPSARLLVADGGRLSVAHEALLTHWPRARQQVEQDLRDLQVRARLEGAALLWVNDTGGDRDSLLLPAGRPLSEAQEWCDRFVGEIDPTIRSFVEASAARAEQDAAYERERQRTMTSMATQIEGMRSGFARGWVGPNDQIDTSVMPGATATTISPDGSRVVTAAPDGTAWVWDVTCQPPSAMELEGHEKVVLGAAFSPDGRRVITTSADGTARLWDLTDQPPTSTVLRGHRDRVLNGAFSPDGHKVVTTSDDGSARVWELAGHTPRSIALTAGKYAIVGAAFNPDGRRIVTASSDGTVRVWDLMADLPAPIVLKGNRKAPSETPFHAGELTGVEVARCRLGELIGAGGSGFVYRAVTLDSAETCCVKILYPYYSDRQDLLRVGRRMVRALSSLRHPGVISISGCEPFHWRDWTTIALVMELVDGPDLATWRDGQTIGPQSMALRLSMAMDITEALSAAHNCRFFDEVGVEQIGICHGDIKPKNILVRRDGKPVIIDFMLADATRILPAIHSATVREMRREAMTMAFGTPRYMAPEQEEEGLISRRSDIFSLGMTFLELFRLDQTPGRPAEPSKPVVALIDQMVERDPGRRPGDLQEIWDRLNKLRDSLGMSPLRRKFASFFEG
jgi:hypothetical protein